MAFGTDYTPVGPMPTDIVLGDVDATSMRLARDIRDKGHGIDTRETMARMILKSSTMHNHLIKVNNALKVQNDEYYRQFTDVLKELSEDKDYHSLPEIAGARGGFDTLGERLNGEVFDMSRMGQDVKEAMTGGSVAVVEEDAVDTVNVKNNAITEDKISDRLRKSIYEQPIENYINNGNLKNGLEGWRSVRGTMSFDGPKLRTTFDDTQSVPNMVIIPTLNHTIIQNSKYFLRLKGLAGGGNIYVQLRDTSGAAVVTQTQKITEGMSTYDFTLNVGEQISGNAILWIIVAYDGTETDKFVELETAMLINLSESFGYGKEPTLAESTNLFDRIGYIEGKRPSPYTNSQLYDWTKSNYLSALVLSGQINIDFIGDSGTISTTTHVQIATQNGGKQINPQTHTFSKEVYAMYFFIDSQKSSDDCFVVTTSPSIFIDFSRYIFLGVYYQDKFSSFSQKGIVVNGNNAIENNSNVLAGKSLITLGDSITAGAGVTDKSKVWGGLIAQRNNMSFLNAGISGSTMGEAVDGTDKNASYATDRHLQINGYDYATIWFGWNDYNFCALGTVGTSDTSTTLGAFYATLNYVVRQSVETKLGVIIPYLWNYTETDPQGYSILSLINGIKETCDLFGVPYLDINKCNFLQSWGSDYPNDDRYYVKWDARQKVFTSDTLHPNEKGNEYLSTIIENFIKSL